MEANKNEAIAKMLHRNLCGIIRTEKAAIRYLQSQDILSKTNNCPRYNAHMSLGFMVAAGDVEKERARDKSR